MLFGWAPPNKLSYYVNINDTMSILSRGTCDVWNSRLTLRDKASDCRCGSLLPGAVYRRRSSASLARLVPRCRTPRISAQIDDMSFA